MITLKQLQYALAVEKTLHFKKASELCNISQSAMSTALSELEKQLGAQIFERDNKRVLITAVGQEILTRARTIMLEVTSLEELVDSQKKPLSYPITVGVIPTIAPFLLPKLLPELQQKYPAAELSIVEEQSADLVERVKQGEIDTAILALPYDLDGLLALEFWQEDFYLITPESSELSHLSEVSSQQMNTGKLMLLKEGHCLKDHIIDACHFRPEQTEHGFGATSLNTLIHMVQGNMGTTLIPAMALDSLVKGNKSLKALHLSEPGPHRRIAFILRPNYTRYSSIEALSKLCVATLNG